MSSPTEPDPGLSWLEALARPLPLPVILRTSVTVDGVEHHYQQLVPRHDWDVIARDPALRAGYERQLRASFGQALMERLDPPVTVDMPPPAGEVVVHGEGRRFELGSEA